MKKNEKEQIDIRLKLHPDAEWMELSVEEGTTLEELLRRFDEQVPNDFLAAKTSRLERKVISLKEKIVQEEDYEFLDMSEPSADQIYQRSLIFMYLKAVHDILGEDKVIISNSLNKCIAAAHDSHSREHPNNRTDEDMGHFMNLRIIREQDK